MLLVFVDQRIRFSRSLVIRNRTVVFLAKDKKKKGLNKDLKVFIDKNSQYPRIDKLRFLAEHKLSTSKISPKKIIKWFDQKEPLSGYGKMILGESYILTGNKAKGTNK